MKRGDLLPVSGSAGAKAAVSREERTFSLGRAHRSRPRPAGWRYWLYAVEINPVRKPLAGFQSTKHRGGVGNIASAFQRRASVSRSGAAQAALPLRCNAVPVSRAPRLWKARCACAGNSASTLPAQNQCLARWSSVRGAVPDPETLSQRWNAEPASRTPRRWKARRACAGDAASVLPAQSRRLARRGAVRSSVLDPEILPQRWNAEPAPRTQRRWKARCTGAGSSASVLIAPSRWIALWGGARSSVLTRPPLPRPPARRERCTNRPGDPPRSTRCRCGGSECGKTTRRPPPCLRR